MSDTCDCGGGTDPRALVRAGADREHRAPSALDPASVRVDERRPEHAMVFAAAFASHLQYVTVDGQPDGDWREFFESPHSAQIAAAAIGDVDDYRTIVNERFRVLENPDPSPSPADDARMSRALLDVFDAIGTLAERLDALHESLPHEHALRSSIANVIRTGLGAMLQRLVGCYRAAGELHLIDPGAPPSAGIVLLGRPAASFSELLEGPSRSVEWAEAVGLDDWAQLIDVDPADYRHLLGPAAGTTARINHLASHNLFRAAADAFLAALARVVAEARGAITASLAERGHEPHYALFIAFLRLLEHGRDAINAFSGNHLEFYYRRVLRLSERAAEPAHAHALAQLAKHVPQHLVPEGALIRAGKDETGAPAHFRVDRDLVANEASVERLARLFRNPAPLPHTADQQRIYADVVAPDAESWHPFAAKEYRDGRLVEIAMEPARVGIAIASHYLWMAEGKRTLTLRCKAGAGSGTAPPSLRLTCLLTTQQGWLEPSVEQRDGDALTLDISLKGDDPPVTRYDPAVHGYALDTTLPVLVVLLRHDDGAAWDYAALEDVAISGIRLDVDVDGLRTLQLSNDHGPVDASKPFLVYGSTPLPGSSLVIGSKEIFQKDTSEVRITTRFLVEPTAHAPAGGKQPTVSIERLSEGEWQPSGPSALPVGTAEYVLDADDLPAPVIDVPDLAADDPYTTASSSGFIRLLLSDGFGTESYPLSLAQWVAAGGDQAAPPPPVLPTTDGISIRYGAGTDLRLDAPSEGGGRFFHITPFGHSEQTIPEGGSAPLVPQFLTCACPSEGELHLGIRSLHPPQDLSLLFQVVDGTADPLSAKPDEHVAWSYLRGEEWATVPASAVSDATGGLLASGITTISVPADASTEHTLMPGGLHWLRLSVTGGADAVCRLAAVRAQALRATSTRAAGAVAPAGTLAKLDPPDAAVKAIEQPYPSFGGRPPETAEAFRARVSERLRHKDRAIALWDYEHLILERFPSIFQARCLNHTQYEPSASGTGVYRELAPGHVTVVTIPDLAVPDQRDPLRPFTSLRVLTEVERFLSTRMSCFTELHVRNPQFEEVRVSLHVRLHPGYDETFHLERLRRELTELLSPWAFRSGARPSFNGRIRKSVVIDFIEERPYVDYVTDVQLFHLVPGRSGEGPDLEDVSGSRAISILVSTPATEHTLLPIHEHGSASIPAGCRCGEAVR